MSLREIYLGDGLYASYDGHMIRLRAPREDGNNDVFLEPETFFALIEYVMQLDDERFTRSVADKKGPASEH